METCEGAPLVTELLPGQFKLTLFTEISRLHSFNGFVKLDGVRPAAWQDEVIEGAAILVAHEKAGARIIWTGRQSEIRSKAFRQLLGRARPKRVSLKKAVVIPAFQECHTHLLYAGDRREEFERRNRGESYLQIAEAGGGIRSTIRATKKAKASDLMSGMIERLQEFAAQGVTTVEIKTGYAATIEDELSHLKLLVKLRTESLKKGKLPRVVLTCLAAHSVPDGFTEAQWLERVEGGIFPFLKKHRIRVDAFIEKSAYSLERVRKHFEKALELGLDVAVHADQLSRSGAARLGAELGAKSVDHVIESSDEDFQRLAISETVAVLLPAADLYTRLPYPRARRMIDSGVRVALATDHNPGSSPGLDLTLVGLLARTNMQMTLPEVLCAYTYNAARAMGLGSSLGALVPGRFADFVCLRPGTELTDLFYEIGPRRSLIQLVSVWRDGVCLSTASKPPMPAK